MLRPIAAAVLLGTALAACSPTFNWREVRVEPTRLQAMLPCEPDHASRRLPMGEREVEMAGLGCETGGVTYTILTADLGDPARVPEALALWQRASLSNLRGTAAATRPFQVPGAASAPAPVRVSLQGQRGDRAPVKAEAVYFAQGARVFQAMVFAAEPAPTVVEPFFEGLRFR